MALIETKRCYDCGLVKPIEAFAFANKARGTRQARCRSCHATYRRQHYVRNRDVYIRREVGRIKRNREQNRSLIREYLRAHPCVDCGETDIVTLQFDHRDRLTKRTEVALLVVRKSWSIVLAEIAKCDVRCANCHRRRTASQPGVAPVRSGVKGRGQPNPHHSGAIAREVWTSPMYRLRESKTSRGLCLSRPRSGTAPSSL